MCILLVMNGNPLSNYSGIIQVRIMKSCMYKLCNNLKQNRKPTSYLLYCESTVNLGTTFFLNLRNRAAFTSFWCSLSYVFVTLLPESNHFGIAGWYTLTAAKQGLMVSSVIHCSLKINSQMKFVTVILFIFADNFISDFFFFFSGNEFH